MLLTLPCQSRDIESKDIGTWKLQRLRLETDSAEYEYSATEPQESSQGHEEDLQHSPKRHKKSRWESSEDHKNINQTKKQVSQKSFPANALPVSSRTKFLE